MMGTPNYSEQKLIFKYFITSTLLPAMSNQDLYSLDRKDIQRASTSPMASRKFYLRLLPNVSVEYNILCHYSPTKHIYYIHRAVQLVIIH
jgi:hypothetical protein